MSDTDVSFPAAPAANSIIEQVAKAMFESTHGYHEDLNWDNAYEEHKELYRKLARVSQPVWHDYYTNGDYVSDAPDTSWVTFTKVGKSE